MWQITMYQCIHNFKGCNFQGFCDQLAIHEIFILKISLAKFCEHIRKLWLASVKEQDTHK